MNNNNLLITGGAGFIGSNFVRYWMQHYPKDRVIVYDALTYAGNLNNLNELFNNKNFHFIKGNILNFDLLYQTLKDENINTVINFAAETHVDNSINNPGIFTKTNVLGTQQLLEATRKAWPYKNSKKEFYRFHHVSTDEVYGSLPKNVAALTESAAFAPNSPYAASKAAADHLVRAYHQTYGLPTSISHCSNNFGPYHHPEKLLPKAIIRILQGKKIPIYGNGNNKRDWLYVYDHCRAIDMIIRHGTVGQRYNIAAGNEWSNIVLIQTLCTFIDNQFKMNPTLKKQFPNCPAANNQASEILISFVADRLGHDFRYSINTAKIKALGFKTSLIFESGLQRTLNWYTRNTAWWLNRHKEYY